jgi:hypothetical protein
MKTTITKTEFDDAVEAPLRNKIMSAVNRQWQQWQIEAGVPARHCDGLGGLHDPKVHAALEDS